MRGQDLGQQILVFGLQQRVHGACGQRGKGRVHRRKYGEGSRALQRVDQTGGLHGGNQGGVIGRVYGVFDDVALFQHRGAADIGVRGVSGLGDAGQSDGA